MSIQDNPCRVVRTLNSEVSLLGHGLETDGDILYEFLHDSQTNKVSISRSTKARYGKDFVEANESTQVLIDFANANQPHPPTETHEENPTDVTTGNEDIPQWQKEGYSSKAEWKAAHKGE